MIEADSFRRVVYGREHGSTSVRIEREIELLREYRTRLIADVATGKLDVREVAALLPELALEAAEETNDTETNETLDNLAETDA